jgi:hypothetical protein
MLTGMREEDWATVLCTRRRNNRPLSGAWGVRVAA